MKGFPAQFTDLSGETFFAENFKLFPKTPQQTAPLIRSKWREKYFCGEIWKTPSKLEPQFRVSRRDFWKVEGIFKLLCQNLEKFPNWLVGRVLKNFLQNSFYFCQKNSQLSSRGVRRKILKSSFVQIRKNFPVD